jgi:RNA polymerase sigma factor (sigma-70 family)
MDNPLDDALERLRKVVAVQSLDGLTDCELLERFVAAQDESAFTVLVERHGPMVLGVCRRLLPGYHDAEDVCQATFLILARKAGSLRRKESLACWLHGIASRVAASLKRDVARRKCREADAAPHSPGDPAVEVSWREVRAALDEEMGRLPEKYRAPLVLCYLECLTRDEAARHLGVSPGTLHGRLQRGRDLLRDRLTGRGLSFSSVLFAGMPDAVGSLSAAFAISSAKAAALFAAGQPLTEVVGAKVLTLTQEVLKTMFLAKVKLGAALVLCAVLVLVGGAFASLGFAQDSRPKPPAILAEKTESDEEFIRRLSKELRNAEPTPAEVYFFASSKDADKRQKLIDLFTQERQTRKVADAVARKEQASGVDTPREPTAEQLKEAQDAFAKIEGTYKEVTDPQTKQVTHEFVLPREIPEEDLKNLPSPPFAFGLVLQSAKITDAGMKELATRKNLTKLNLFGTQVTDKGLKELAELKNLTSLFLFGTSVTDAGLAELANVKNLTVLGFGSPVGLLGPAGPQVTDAGLKELKNIKNLTRLIIQSPQVTDAGLKELKDVKNLTGLSLFHTRVTDRGLKELTDVKTLTNLNLSSPRLGDAGLAELKALKNLTNLGLVGTQVTDLGLKDLAELKNLTNLSLQGTKVTDAGMKELASLKNLTRLSVPNTKVTAAGVKELQQALPNCKISR